ncbi:MAG: hypothetical protein ACOC22_03015 [bacterium]
MEDIDKVITILKEIRTGIGILVIIGAWFFLRDLITTIYTNVFENKN